MNSISKIAMAATAAVTMLATTATAAPEFKFNGDVQYRLRGEWKMDLDSAGDYYGDSKAGEYSNKYLWNLKMAAKVNDNLTMKFRLSNPKGSGLETVKPGELPDAGHLLSVPQAEIQYKSGVFSMSAGIIEVKGSTVLNLATSAEDGGYAGGMNISDSWGTWTNNSLAGLKFGFDAGKMVDVNVTYALAKYAKATDEVPSYTNFRLIADAPVKLGENGQYLLTPSVSVLYGITSDAMDPAKDRNYNTNAGLDFSAKINKTVSVKAGAAYGTYYDANGAWEQPSGLLLMVKPTVKFGMNVLTLGYSFGHGSDANDDSDKAVATLYNHVDFKWGVKVAKNFTIMPRYRFYSTSYTEDSMGSSIKHRPELIFVGKF